MILKIFTVCFALECANENFETLKKLSPIEINFKHCTRPHEWDCINENLLQVRDSLFINVWPRCRNYPCINANFADIERALGFLIGGKE
jgi:hypothetical protein